MRITTGSAKGRQVPLPKGATVRPTSDRVKQALFNILGPGGLQGWNALDLFCGSGNLGLEALSRGASMAAFCDQDRRCVEQARDLAQSFGLDAEGRCLYIAQEASVALARLARESRRFHLVMIDPPYQSEAGPKALSSPLWPQLLHEGAWLIYEHETHKPLPATPGLALVRQASYGSTSLAFYQPLAAPSAVESAP